MKKTFLLLLYLSATSIFGQSKTISKIDSLLSKYQNSNAPGMSVGILKEGKIIYSKSYGEANLEYGIKNSDTTVFGLASIAKQFTASCIWALTKEGKIALDDNIRKYIPEFPKHKYDIKIRHLLNHSSGLSNYHTLMDCKGFDYDLNYYDNQTVLELALQQKNLNYEPGEKISYSNTNYTLLAIIIERISGKNLQDYAKEKIFLPLEMTSACIRTENNSLIKNRAIGYQKKDNDYIQNPKIQRSYGAGSMGASIQDLFKWINVLNGKNAAFSDLSVFLTTCEKLTNGETAKYARGLLIDTYKNYKTISHSGYGWGGQTQILTVPEEDLGIIILSNLESINPTPISYQILDELLPIKESKADKINQNQVKIKNISTLVGDYVEIDSDMKMTISSENRKLAARGSQAKKATLLKLKENNIYVRENNESVSYDFDNPLAELVISFGGVPFYFKRALFVTPSEVKLEEYVGDYYSEELNVMYHFYSKDNQLFLDYMNNKEIALTPVQKNEFGNNNRTLYQFQKDKNNKVKSMKLSCQGAVKEIGFIKK